MENNLLQKRYIYFDNHSGALKMSVEVKYTVANNSTHAKEPKQTTSGSAGYDLFAAELKTLIPKDVTPISIELCMEIPDGYFGKMYPRSHLLEKNFISCD